MESHKLDGMDYTNFINILEIILYENFESQSPCFTMAYPRNTDSSNSKMPIIVHQLTSMQPGVIGNNETREIKPRHRETIIEKRIIEKSIYSEDCIDVQYRGQFIDAYIDFTIYETSNKKLLEWTNRFRKLIQENLGTFIAKGVVKLVWLSEEDVSGNLKSTYYVQRKISYLLRFEEIYRYELIDLNQINVRLDTITQLKEFKKWKKSNLKYEKQARYIKWKFSNKKYKKQNGTITFTVFDRHALKRKLFKCKKVTKKNKEEAING